MLPRRPPSLGPRVDATVVTIRTTFQPAGRTTTHTLLISPSKARSTDEAESWRLYDLEARTVTFVNDLERTYRTEPVDSVFAQRRTALRRPVDRELPAAEFQSTGAEREILGVPATQSLIRLGGYQRELWFASHPSIPDELFAMIHGTAEPATRLGAIVAKADEELIAARGFPLLDRAELPYGKSNMVVERSVVAIEPKEVLASLLQVPPGYRDLTAPAERRRPASSRPRDRAAPASESPPSATSQTTP
ncbi:MAG TPA: hypothetical protein VNA04_08105 [Thermoanaerobaculia bacterium]|nr:hypothetical protein [Thermoanaerobaculia bacterium]